MKKTKTQKGITLVALIITIVVLLILAMVAIGAVQDSNIIGHAQNAASMYNTKQDKEEGLLNEYLNEIEKNIPGSDNKVFVGGTYIGESGKIIVTADYKITVYNASGTLLFENIQSEEISAPEEVENPEQYSKFFKMTVDGRTIYSALSNDHSVLYTSDGSVYYLVYDNPKVYTISDSRYTWHFIEVTEKYGVLVLKKDGSLSGEPGITKTVESSDIFAIENTPFSGTITNNSKITYSKVSYNAFLGVVYNTQGKNWILISGTITDINNGGLTDPIIDAEKALTLDTSMSEEEINSYILSAQFN